MSNFFKKLKRKLFPQTIEGASKKLAKRFEPISAKKLTLIAYKEEKLIKVYNENKELISEYPVLKDSGSLGPKLKEGDKQVPEGFYKIDYLNPNSLYHLSMKLNYPNDFDRAQAEKDGRTKLGFDICIHGKAESVGCLAIGDPNIEKLFYQVAQVGIENVEIIITPFDLTQKPIPDNTIPWVQSLYAEIKDNLESFRN